MSAPFRSYVPPGLVAARFLSSDALVRAIAGPVGSGKTGSCLMEMLYRGMRQAPHPRDNVRRTKFVVIRDTYRNLENTTIKSWGYWVPPDAQSPMVGGSSGAPATHTINKRLADGTILEIIVQFVGLGIHSAEMAMPGFEATGAYLNELNTLTRDTLLFVKERVGRYPAVDVEAGFEGATWRGVWGDFNKPDMDHWLYEDFVDKLDPEYAFFDQPGAMVEIDGVWQLNPKRENAANVLPGYYHQQLAGAPRWRIRSRVGNQWVASRDGQAVYDEDWNEELHKAPGPIAPVMGVALGLGLDAGMHPAAIVGQRMANGQRRVLSEVIGAAGTGARRFGRDLRQFLFDHYQWWLLNGMITISYADPSAAYGADAQEGEATWIQIVAEATGCLIVGAPTNALIPRLESVRAPMNRNCGGQPGLLVSRDCKVLIKVMNGGYRYHKTQVAGSEKIATEPLKNDFSHVQDALQYWCAGDGEYFELQQKHGPTAVPGANTTGQHRSDFDPQAEPSTWGNARSASTSYDAFDPNRL